MIRLRLPALLAAALLLSACASTPGRPYDPFEASNRVMYAINDPLDKYIAKPIAQAWVDYVPSFIRTGASNYFNNIDDLFSGINGLLQGKLDKAGDDFGRVMINTGFGFDGLTSAYVNVFTAPDLDFTSGFTIDAWININGSVGNSGRIVDKIHTFSNDGFLLDVAGGHLRVIGGGVGLAAADPIATDVFRHVVAVFDANRIALFVNGTLAALAPTNGAMVPTNGLPVRIGADSDGGSDFPGIIDEVRLFNRGLTDDEARLLFQQYSSCPR